MFDRDNLSDFEIFIHYVIIKKIYKSYLFFEKVFSPVFKFIVMVLKKVLFDIV